MDVIDRDTFDRTVKTLQGQIAQLGLAVDGLAERLDALSSPPAVGAPGTTAAGTPFRLKLNDPAPASASAPFGLKAYEPAVGDDAASAALRRLRAERPFQASPYDKAAILTAGNRAVAAVYTAEERDALVRLLNGG